MNDIIDSTVHDTLTQIYMEIPHAELHDNAIVTGTQMMTIDVDGVDDNYGTHLLTWTFYELLTGAFPEHDEWVPVSTDTGTDGAAMRAARFVFR